MKWPFVSRERLDAAERFLALAHAEARRERDIADARYDALLEKFTALRVQGAVPEPKPEAESQALPTLAVDSLKVLIGERCGNNVTLRKLMLRQLAIDRATGKSDDEIQKSIEQGVSSDGVPV